MQAPILESIRKNLFEKRDRINEWLRATPLSTDEVVPHVRICGEGAG